jgi:hypothetical protein
VRHAALRQVSVVPPGPRRLRLAVVACLAVPLVLVAGCRTSPSPSATTTPYLSLRVSAPASAADPHVEVQQAVAAYLNGLNAYVTQSNSGGTDTTGMAQYLTGSALDVLATGLRRHQARAVTSRGYPGIDAPQVTDIAPANDPRTVKVAGCLDDSHWLLYRSDGHLEDAAPGGRRRVTAQIDKTGGGWMVSRLAIGEVGTCTASAGS